jgi:hypothetical protein
MSEVLSDTQRPNGQAGSQAGSQARPEDFSKQAKGVVDDLKTKASQMTDTVTQTAKERASEVGAAASQMAGEAREKVEAAAAHQKSRGADYIGAIAGAMNRAAGEFENEVPQAAHYIRQASEQVNGFADTVRQRDVRELVGEVQDFARRQPTLFFGGAVLLGFAALRFLKSATPAETASAGPAFQQPREAQG